MVCISEGSDELFRSRIEDTVRLCEKRSAPCFLGFLDLREQAFAEEVLRAMRVNHCFFSGGYSEAERKLLCVYPDFYSAEDVECPITLLAFRYRTVKQLSHRDFLGTLLNKGIRRDKIGDILCGCGYSVVAVREEIAQFIVDEVDKIGGEGVAVITDYSGDLPIAREYVELRDTIASPRLDSIVKSLIRASREKAAELIRVGSISVNHKPVESVSHTVTAPATVSIRGFGRFMIDQIGPETKKGRLLLAARKCI